VRAARQRSFVPSPRRCTGGFTLVEVLVALFVMALMAALAWQGVDAVLKSRDAGRDAVDRSALIGTLLSQWETDLQSLHDQSGVQTLAFDGRSLRLVRRSEGAVQLVVWSLSGRSWQRWASPPTTRLAELQQAWMRSQQLADNDPALLRLLDGVDSWQVYFYRGNAWSNAQSSADFAAAAAAPASAASAAGVEQLPSGVRLVLQIEGKTLTRDLLVTPAS
jgi:general secretion pathway protein J